MSEMPSPAGIRCGKVLQQLLSGDSDYRVGVVVLSYRRPGAGERDVSYASATAMRAEDGALDFVMMAQTLRKIADELDALVKDPAEMAKKAVGIPLGGKWP